VTDAAADFICTRTPTANLVLVTDDNSTPAERYHYDAFGEPDDLERRRRPRAARKHRRPRPALRRHALPRRRRPLRRGARHYDPITGVFLARDPNLHADSPSPYAYCGHNPVGRIDPDGALWGPLLFGVFGAAANLIGLWRSGADFDAWDVLAAGAIGFGAGFVGAATFGRAAAGITRGLLSVAGRSPVALGAKTSIAISVGSGAGAGLVSGGVSGSLAGAAGAPTPACVAAATRGTSPAPAPRARASPAWQRASSAAPCSRAASAPVYCPPALGGGSWVRHVARRRHGAGAPAPSSSGVWRAPRAWASGAGFASGFTGGLVNHLQAGGDFQDGLGPALDSAAMGAALGFTASALSPVTYQYWRARANTDVAVHLQQARRHTVGRHHQRNVAQYPEYSSPTSPQNSWIDSLATRFTRGNVSGRSSIIPSEAVHETWHRQWGTSRGLWSQVPSHGPWTPAVSLTSSLASALPQNHSHKSEE
jgi:RHS repeat-associated protein